MILNSNPDISLRFIKKAIVKDKYAEFKSQDTIMESIILQLDHKYED